MARPFKFTVQELKKLYEEYKVYRSNQHDVIYDSIKSGDRAGETFERKIPKVYTIASFCHFIDTTEKTFFNWINEDSNNIDNELLQFVTRIQEEFKDDRLSKGLNGAINAQLLTRLDGYKDSTEISTGSDNSVINIQIGTKDLSLNK